MKIQLGVAAGMIVCTTVLITALPGCAVTRDQSTVGAYIDDSAITARVKTRLFEDKAVDGTAISVETLNGTVMLSGFAKDRLEMATAGYIAHNVPGVKSVKNEIAVRP